MGKAGRKSSFNRLSWQNVKALLGEVDIEAECLREIQPPHGFKAHDVNQAQAPPRGGGAVQSALQGFGFPGGRFMSEYTYVERPFLDQLRAPGWEFIDQGEGFPAADPAVTLRAGFRELILPQGVPRFLSTCLG